MGVCLLPFDPASPSKELRSTLPRGFDALWQTTHFGWNTFFESQRKVGCGVSTTDVGGTGFTGAMTSLVPRVPQPARIIVRVESSKRVEGFISLPAEQYICLKAGTCTGWKW